MSVPELDPITLPNNDTLPDITNLTSSAVDGTGVFDKVMGTIKLHLQEEFNSGRIDSSKYSDIYVGALSVGLSQSVQYLLNHQSEKRIAAEIGLIRQQIVTELANTDDAIPTGLGFNATADILGILEGKKAIDAKQLTVLDTQNDLVEQQIVTELAQTAEVKPADLGKSPSVNITGITAAERALKEKQSDLIDAQILNAGTEKVLLGQKIVTELAQTDDDIGPATALSYGLNDGLTVEGKLRSDIDHQDAEKLLIDQKTLSELGQISDTLADGITPIEGLIGSKRAIDALQANLVTAQVGASEADKALTEQKVITELAQTNDDLSLAVTAGIGITGNTITGVAKSAIDKNTQETALLAQKTTTELAQTSDAAGGIAKGQLDKLVKESTLLAQKAITELAQTSDTVVTSTEALNTTATIGGVVAKENTVRERQADGFLRDAEQKLASLMIEAFKVDATMGNASGDDTVNFLGDESLGSVITKAKTGIGVTGT